MLRAFVITTGRSGTRSLSGFLDMLLRHAGGGSARDHSDVYSLIRVGLDRLTRPDYDPAPIVEMLRNWPHDIEVNPGPCFVLPEVLQAFGPELPVIHLIRDREGFVASCARHVAAGRARWGNFVDQGGRPPEVMRPTAVHFGEMGMAEWQALSLRERLGWLYDAHRRETERMLPCFRRTLTVRTDDLNSREEQRRIADFLGLRVDGSAMPWLGWGRGAMVEGVDPAKVEHLQLTLQRFDWNRALADPYYPFMHFAQVEIAWFMRDPDDGQRRRNLSMVRDAIDQALNEKPEKAGPGGPGG